MQAYTFHWFIQLIFACILTPFILVGNILVIASVAKFKRLQVPTNYFLILLAVADVSVAILLPLLIVSDTYRHNMNSEYLCLLCECLMMTVRGVSILAVMAVACDRHIAIVFPMDYIYIVTVTRIVIFGVISWVFSAFINFSPFMGWIYKLEDKGKNCSYSLVDSKSVLLLFCAIFLPTYIVIFYCYSRIFCIARKHVHAIHAVEVSLYRSLKFRYLAKDTKYAKTLAIVVLILVLLWLPFQLCLLIEKFSSLYVPEWVHSYLALLTYTNSGINPWIYAYKTKEFRAAFKKIHHLLKNKITDFFTQDAVVPGEGSQGSLPLSRTNSRADQENIIIQDLYHHDNKPNTSGAQCMDSAEPNLNEVDDRVKLGTVSGQCAFMLANTATMMNIIEGSHPSRTKTDQKISQCSSLQGGNSSNLPDVCSS